MGRGKPPLVSEIPFADVQWLPAPSPVITAPGAATVHALWPMGRVTHRVRRWGFRETNRTRTNQSVGRLSPAGLGQGPGRKLLRQQPAAAAGRGSGGKGPGGPPPSLRAGPGACVPVDVPQPRVALHLRRRLQPVPLVHRGPPAAGGKQVPPDDGVGMAWVGEGRVGGRGGGSGAARALARSHLRKSQAARERPYSSGTSTGASLRI